MELTTPTGAAVAVTLANRFGVLPPMTVARTGYGAGGHDFPEHANVLRVMIGEPTGAAEALTVSVIEANIDDLNPQVLAYATERLMEAGALDVSLEPIVMKKGRPGNLLRVIAKPEDREALAQIDFRRDLHPRPAHLHRRAPRAGAQLDGSGNPLRQRAREGDRRRRFTRPSTKIAASWRSPPAWRSSTSSPKRITPT